MRINFAAVVLLVALASGCAGRHAGRQSPAAPPPPEARLEAPSMVRGARSRAASSDPSAACRRAGGTAKVIKECDGSESLWCDISKREACYADQVSGGRCTAGEYSEELKGITGITPRVLCDQGQ